MPTASDVLLTAQSHMNDFSQKMWTKEELFVFLAASHKDMQRQLQINGIPVIKEKSAVSTVPPVNLQSWPGYVVMPNQPGDMIEPLECWERPTGDTLECDWDLMIQKSWVPETQPVTDLVYWNWIAETVRFLGATQSVDVKLYYNGGLVVPSSDDAPLGMINAEDYLAPRLAYYALRSIGAKQGAAEMVSLAAQAMEEILQYQILAEQAMPFRRRPYRHGRVPFMIR
jgi:hypothetical protein